MFFGSETTEEEKDVIRELYAAQQRFNQLWVLPRLETDRGVDSVGVTYFILFHSPPPPDDWKGTLKELVKWYYEGQKIGKINRYDWAEHLATQYTHKGKPISPGSLRTICSQQLKLQMPKKRRL